MGNFFKTIASAFVEVQNDAPQTVESNVKQNTPSTQMVAPVMATPVQSIPAVGQPIVNSDGTIQGQLDNKLFELLCDVVEESNIPGPDYVELTKAAQNDSMKAAIPDENARLMAAYISMKATAPQLNRGVVLGSIDTYVGILEKERQNGLGELQTQWIENVENPEKEVIKAQEDIAKLQQELQTKIQFVAEQKTKIANSKNDHNIKKANFNYTFDVFIKKLQDDKVKLDAILQD
jgi:hypothetical protein